MASKRPPLTEEHKAKIAEGLSEAAVIRNYLEILRERPGPGKRRTKNMIEKRISEVDAALREPLSLDPIRMLEMIQEKMDLEAELATAPETKEERLARAEEDFVLVAKSFTEKKHLSYAAWRAAGVPASVLKRAGIPATRSPR